MHYCKDGGTRATHESSPHLCLPQEPHLQICQEKKLREHRTLEVIIHLKTTELLRFIAYLGQLLGTRPAPVGINRIDPKRRLEKENLETVYHGILHDLAPPTAPARTLPQEKGNVRTKLGTHRFQFSTFKACSLHFIKGAQRSSRITAPASEACSSRNALVKDYAV